MLVNKPINASQGPISSILAASSGTSSNHGEQPANKQSYFQ